MAAEEEITPATAVVATRATAVVAVEMTVTAAATDEETTD